MIYDRWVYAGLNDLPEHEKPRSSDVGSYLPSPDKRVNQKAYETWCLWASNRADEHGVRPDDVEFALFAEGNPDL